MPSFNELEKLLYFHILLKIQYKDESQYCFDVGSILYYHNVISQEYLRI